MASNSTIEMAATETSNTDQQIEIDSIKTAFPNRCRVISDVGEFSKVVTVQPENMDVTIKFQLPVGYPSVIPEITIRSESLTKESIADLRQLLRSRAREMIGQHMIKPLVSEAETQFRAIGLKPGKTVSANVNTFLDKHHKKSRKQKVKPKSEDEVQDKKLPSMKTADDVVKRIIWDDALEKDDFVVGYFDRFRGLVEKCFSAFSWEDLASVDYDVLAVPKHRIQYFKYKNVKVWDKTKRVDNVFGSADGTKTIDIVIQELQELQRLGQTENSGILQNNNSEEDNSSNDSESDDDDCGVEVIIGNITNVPSADYAKDKHCHIGYRDTSDENRFRPNHFLCVRITSEEILDKIGKFQDELMEKEPMFSACCIPGASLHLTLIALGLDTPDQILQCAEALRNEKDTLQSALPTSNLRLHGISNFFNRVIFAQIQHDNDFLEFYRIVKQILQEAGVQIRDGFDFVPHMTIMKITRPVARALGTNSVSPHLYSHHTETEFGEQKVDSIYLCSMGTERREDGFYLSPLELHFEK